MEIYLPKICDKVTVFAVLGQVFDEEGEHFSDHYLFDASAVSSIDPFSQVLLNNLFAWLANRGYTMRIVSPDLDSSKYLHEDGPIPFNDTILVHEGMIPLAHIPKERTSSWVLTTFHRWLAEVLGVSTLSLFSPLQFVRLLFRYAAQYGQSEGVILHARLEKGRQNLRIVVAHYGEGIPDLARNSWSAFANPAVVIAKATEGPAQESSAHEGSSLMFLIDDVIVENGGIVTIYSGFGQTRATRNQVGITQKLAINNAFVPGAIFDITFRLNATGLLSRINEPSDSEFMVQHSRSSEEIDV